MDVDVLQLSLLELDESPKDAPRVEGQPVARQGTTAADMPRSRRPRSETAASTSGGGETLLTTDEVAKLLHVHPRTVQRLVARGQLAAIRLGSAVRFDPDDVGSLIGEHKGRCAGTAQPAMSRIRATRSTRTSFADRLRSQAHEHRAAHA
jgi:excisionase family DNA binding protein